LKFSFAPKFLSAPVTNFPCVLTYLTFVLFRNKRFFQTCTYGLNRLRTRECQTWHTTCSRLIYQRELLKIILPFLVPFWASGFPLIYIYFKLMVIREGPARREGKRFLQSSASFCRSWKTHQFILRRSMVHSITFRKVVNSLY